MTSTFDSPPPVEVPFEAETWGMPIEHEPEHIPEIPPDLSEDVDDPSLR